MTTHEELTAATRKRIAESRALLDGARKVTKGAPYKKKCTGCGYITLLYTQEDSGPSEYITEVNVVCRCGQLVHFRLPVN